jgi:hypothetical protein
MSFPFSIDGRVTLDIDALPPGLDPVQRLAAALHAQTVDSIEVVGTTLRFRPITKGNDDRPRPEGNGWKLGSTGAGSLIVTHHDRQVEVRYRIDTRLLFWLPTILAPLIFAAIRIHGGVEQERTALFFATGIWSVWFLATYVSVWWEFARWLRANLTSAELAPVKRLRVPSSP